MRLTIALLCLPAALTAQNPDTTKGLPLPVTDSALRIPADRASDLVPWTPGGGLDETGAPTWHGIPVGRGTWTIDGVRWASGLRSTGWLGVGPLPIRLEPGLNSLAGAALRPSATSPLTLDFTTLGAGERWTARGSTETGAPFRPAGGTGDSRLEAAAGGPVGRNFRLQLGGTLGARQAASGGVGYGDAPYYLATGIDTTMAVPVKDYSTGLYDTIYEPIQHYSATNKVPYTPRGTADWTMRIDGRVGDATTWAHWIGTRQAEGFFRYSDAFNPVQMSGLDQHGYDLAAGIEAPLGSRLLTATVAVQHERTEQGPLTYASQLDARNAGLGLMLNGLDLRWDMENFPVDAQLVTNYRNNLVGSRRSPYDLENTDQYRLADNYRNSPYAMYGWSEGGGPTGQLRFYDDRRLVASAGLTQGGILGGSATIGAEVVRHDARLYAFALTSEANSNVWIEHPDEAAVTLEWTYHALGWMLDLGTRIDRFNSHGRRSYDRVNDPSDPRFGKYLWFPRGFSVAATDPANVHWVADDAHTASAPHASLRGAVSGVWGVQLGYQRSATIPDFADLYSEINTDLAITNTGAVFGRDLGHEIVDHFEGGLAWHRGILQTGATYFQDRYRKVVANRLGSFYDPLKKQINDLVYNHLEAGPTIKGATLTASASVTRHISIAGAYTNLTTQMVDFYYDYLYTLVEESPLRHHSFAATARWTGSERGLTAGLGALVSVRLMSGLAEAIPSSGPPSTFPGIVRSHELPAWKSVDLRLVKTTAIAGHRAAAFVDARNLFNTANLLHAFATGDPRRSTTAQASAWSTDSITYAVEAKRNGVYIGGGTIDLRFSGAGRGGCGTWVAASGAPNPPNCAYLIAAEQRFGNGDGLFTAGEQRATSTSYYLTQVGAGATNGPPRAIRAGLEFAF